MECRRRRSTGQSHSNDRDSIVLWSSWHGLVETRRTMSCRRHWVRWGWGIWHAWFVRSDDGSIDSSLHAIEEGVRVRAWPLTARPLMVSVSCLYPHLRLKLYITRHPSSSPHPQDMGKVLLFFTHWRHQRNLRNKKRRKSTTPNDIHKSLVRFTVIITILRACFTLFLLPFL